VSRGGGEEPPLDGPAPRDRAGPEPGDELQRDGGERLGALEPGRRGGGWKKQRRGGGEQGRHVGAERGAGDGAERGGGRRRLRVGDQVLVGRERDAGGGLVRTDVAEGVAQALVVVGRVGRERGGRHVAGAAGAAEAGEGVAHGGQLGWVVIVRIKTVGNGGKTTKSFPFSYLFYRFKTEMKKSELKYGSE
jgi:hypothetical protein